MWSSRDIVAAIKLLGVSAWGLVISYLTVAAVPDAPWVVLTLVACSVLAYAVALLWRR